MKFGTFWIITISEWVDGFSMALVHCHNPGMKNWHIAARLTNISKIVFCCLWGRSGSLRQERIWWWRPVLKGTILNVWALFSSCSWEKATGAGIHCSWNGCSPFQPAATDKIYFFCSPCNLFIGPLPSLNVIFHFCHLLVIRLFLNSSLSLLL